MLKCYFCTSLADFECSGNLFCIKHKQEHDATHKGFHHFRDAFCKFTKQGKADFKNEISSRLKKLIEYKKALTVATTNYIKSIQNSFLQKIAEIDKIKRSYIGLVMKKPLDKPDAEIIEDILKTRLILKPLEDFSENKFENYLQQKILESEELLLKNTKDEGILSLLSNEAQFLIDVIRCCKPQNIPEKMLRSIVVSRIGEKGWYKARGELVNLTIVNRDKSSKLWSIEKIYIFQFEKREIRVSVNEECLKFCAKSLESDDNYGEHRTRIEIQEMLVHAEKIIENTKIKNINEANVLFKLGRAYFALHQDLEKAEIYYLRCLKFQEQFLPETHSDRAALYMSLGDLYIKNADYDKALSYYFQCPEVQNKILPEIHPDRGLLYFHLGGLYESKADYNKAESYYLQSLKIQEQALPVSLSDRASLIMSLGILYYYKGDYDQSENYYLQCLNIQKQILPEIHPDRASLYENLGIIYKIKADYNQAESYYLQCLKIREQILQETHPNRASLYLNLGELYNTKADYEAAESYYLHCLKIQKQTLPESHPHQAVLYMNLGGLYLNKEDYTKAESYYMLCLKIQKQILPESYPGRASLYMHLGNLFEKKADYDKAEIYYLKCLKIHERYLQKTILIKQAFI